MSKKKKKKQGNIKELFEIAKLLLEILLVIAMIIKEIITKSK